MYPLSFKPSSIETDFLKTITLASSPGLMFDAITKSSLKCDLLNFVRSAELYHCT